MTGRQQIDAEMEREIQTLGLTAPRVTPQRIKEVIASEHYFTADMPFQLPHLVELSGGVPNEDKLRVLTFCVLVLQNGFTVTGESACASPENFNAEIGRKIARENAINKVWMLEGYLLSQATCSVAAGTGKLESFTGTISFCALSADEQSRMKRQLVAMREYLAELNERIGALESCQQ